jgi:hypothetical protein
MCLQTPFSYFRKVALSAIPSKHMLGILRVLQVPFLMPVCGPAIMQVLQQVTNVVVEGFATIQSRQRRKSNSSGSAATATERQAGRLVGALPRTGRSSPTVRRVGPRNETAGFGDPHLPTSNDDRGAGLHLATHEGVPTGWRPPSIFPSVRSPILLRQRVARNVGVSRGHARYMASLPQPSASGIVDTALLSPNHDIDNGSSHHRG